MSVSRRRFLRSGAVLSAAALVLKPSTLIFAQGSNSGLELNSKTVAHSITRYTRAMFEPYIGETFRVRAGNQMVNLKLVGLTDLDQTSAGITTGKTGQTDGFSILFRATSPLPATPATHTLNHPGIGSFDLFMSQSKESGRFLNTAIVNHLA